MSITDDQPEPDPVLEVGKSLFIDVEGRAIRLDAVLSPAGDLMVQISGVNCDLFPDEPGLHYVVDREAAP